MSNTEFRLSYYGCRDVLAKRLAEPAPARIQLLAGPRQVGKTTLLLEIAEQEPQQTIYAAADAPEAALPGFWERIVDRAEAAAVAHGRAILLLDEAHLLHDWASRKASPAAVGILRASGHGSRMPAWRTRGTRVRTSRTGAKNPSKSMASWKEAGASGRSR